MSKLLEEVYAEVANAMGVPLFEINPVSMKDLNAELESKPTPLFVYFWGANGEAVRELHNSVPFIKYTETVYFLDKPADESSDSLQSTERKLLKMCNEFIQRFSNTEAYTRPDNVPFAPSFKIFYPVFDARLMQISINWTGILWLELPPICSQ